MKRPRDTKDFVYQRGEIEWEDGEEVVHLILHCGHPFLAEALFLNLSKLLKENRLHLGLQPRKRQSRKKK